MEVTVFPVEVKNEGGKWTKKPAISNWQLSSMMLEDITTQNFGMNILPGWIVVDLDLHKNAFIKRQAAEMFGWEIKEDSLIQTTISGGEHHVFKIDSELDVTQGANLGGIEGLDIRCAGRGWICSGDGYTQQCEGRITEFMCSPWVPTINRRFLEQIIKRREAPAPAPVQQSTSQLYRDLEEALTFVLADDYDLWIQTGMALKGVPGGFALWDAWSQKSDKYEREVMQGKWDSFASEGVTYRSIFYHAKMQGWYNPAIIDREGASLDDFEELDDGERPPHPLEQEWQGDPGRYPNYLIDGVLCAELSLLAAYPGTGKTTALAQLAMIVAGFVKLDGLDVDAYRKVVFISEHPEQVAQILEAAYRHYRLPGHYSDRIRLVSAIRMPAEAIVRASWADMAVTHTINEVTADLLPWVILDTQAAVIELMDENDNTEASKVVSEIKQGLIRKGYPVTICAHTSKAHKHGRAEDMTARGASAWEGDVMQVLYLSKDNDGNRFIEVEAPKHRFTVKVHSLQIQMHRDVMSMIDMWGRQREEKVYWVDLFPLDGEQRDELKEMADLEREEAEERKSQRRRDQMRDEVISYVIAHEPTMTELRDGVSGRNATISELVNEMVAEEKMKKVKDGKREKLVWIGGNHSPPEDPF
jgi:RecA-family ATPase